MPLESKFDEFCNFFDWEGEDGGNEKYLRRNRDEHVVQNCNHEKKLADSHQTGLELLRR